jgi:hypothetical protein
MFSLPIDSALIGPERAKGYITRAYPTFDWGEILAIEPRPIIRDGSLYWMFTVTPYNFAGIVDTVLVNSRSGEVLSFGSNYQKVLDFLRGKESGTLIGVGETPVSSSGQITTNTQIKLNRENVDKLINEMRELIEQMEELKSSLPEE